MNIRKDADNFRNPITSAVSFPAPVFPVSVQLIHHLSNDGFTDCYFTGLYPNLSKCNQGEIVYVFDSTCMIFFFQTFLLSSWNQTTLPSTCCSWGAVHSLSNRVNGAKIKKMKSSQQHHIIYRQFFLASSHHRTSCSTRGQPTWLTGTRASSHPGARAWAAAWSFAVPLVPGKGGCSWVNQRSTDLGHTVPVLQLLTHIHPGRQPQSSFYPWTRAHPLSSGLAETGAQGETVIGIQFWLARQIAC